MFTNCLERLFLMLWRRLLSGDGSLGHWHDQKLCLHDQANVVKDRLKELWKNYKEIIAISAYSDEKDSVLTSIFDP